MIELILVQRRRVGLFRGSVLDDVIFLTRRQPSAADGEQIGPQGRRVGRRSAAQGLGGLESAGVVLAHLANIKPVPKTAEVGRRFLGGLANGRDDFVGSSRVPAFPPGS